MELEESGTQKKGKSLKSICIWDDLLKEACSGKSHHCGNSTNTRHSKR